MTTGDVVLGANGSGYAVWVELIGNGKFVRARRYVNGVPQEPQTVSDNVAGFATAESPQVALSANGEALAVWTETAALGGSRNGRAIAAWRHRVTDVGGVHAGVMANVFK